MTDLVLSSTHNVTQQTVEFFKYGTSFKIGAASTPLEFGKRFLFFKKRKINKMRFFRCIGKWLVQCRPRLSVFCSGQNTNGT